MYINVPDEIFKQGIENANNAGFSTSYVDGVAVCEVSTDKSASDYIFEAQENECYTLDSILDYLHSYNEEFDVYDGISMFVEKATLAPLYYLQQLNKLPDDEINEKIDVYKKDLYDEMVDNIKFDFGYFDSEIKDEFMRIYGAYPESSLTDDYDMESIYFKVGLQTCDSSDIIDIKPFVTMFKAKMQGDEKYVEDNLQIANASELSDDELESALLDVDDETFMDVSERVVGQRYFYLMASRAVAPY